MNYKKNITTSELIARSLFKDLSNEERKEFDNWLEEDSRNQILIENILNQQHWEIREENIKKLDKELIWKNISKQISPEKETHTFLLRKVMKYAASILIPLALIYGGWLLNKDIKSDMNKHIAVIIPGESKANLVLSNGQVIELNKNDTILNTKDKNIIIEIDSGKIEYKNKKDVQNKHKTEVHTIKIPRGGEYFLTLSDGTKIWLNSATEIRFPSVFTEKERRVYLKGEAFFEVAKDSEHPFIVHANGLNIRVLGTKFNVSAYPDDEFVCATLVEGEVFVNEQISGLLQSAILEPSQQAFINRNTIQELVVQTVDTDLYTSWTKGKFIFRNESLDVILNKLSRWYNIEVFYDDINAKHFKFSGILPRFENCETFFKIMEKTNCVEFEYTETTVLAKSIK